jgi:purine-binding chemotaxis protein CheW
MTQETQFCTFHVDRYFFGVEVAKVQEVVRHQETTPVPLAAPEITGLINLRGQIVTTLNLRRRLGLPPRTDAALPMNVLISTGDGAVSFQVDQIEDVLSVSPDTVEVPPATMDENVRRVLHGVSKQKGRLLLLLDETKAMGLAS